MYTLEKKWEAAEVLGTIAFWTCFFFWVLHFWSFRSLLSLNFVELSAECAMGHIYDTPAILLVLSFELRETDFDFDCPYRLPPP